MINRTLIATFLLFAIFALSACSGNKTKPEDAVDVPSDEVIDIGAPIDEGVSTGIGDDGVVILDPLDDPGNDLFVRTIYFDYDSANIREDSVTIVRAHGKYLSSNPDRLVRLEGHADERGTREYNLALGEERAKAVRDLIVLEGAQEEQIELVSFGEERPAVDGSDDAALQLNRRVEIVY